jgi:uncharacterized membrane protein
MLAMPFAILLVALALNLFLAPRRLHRPSEAVADDQSSASDLGEPDLPIWRRLMEEMPLGWAGWLVTAVAVGSLLFLNTWDFPAYWLLLVLAVLAVLMRRLAGKRLRWSRSMGGAALAGVGLAAGALLLYAPYFLTAQSQAGGIVPNLFNPTRVGQFFSMFATALLVLLALLMIAWQAARPRGRAVAVSLLVTYGLPLVFLGGSILLATNTEGGRELLARMPLPDDSPGHVAMILQRWGSQFWTFLLAGGLLGLVAAAAWTLLADSRPSQAQDASQEDVAQGAQAGTQAGIGAGAHPNPLLFVLFLGGIGLLLAYAPEFVFLRDNFGTRMNTVFKFYYQAWLLFGLAGAYTISVALGGVRAQPRGAWQVAPAVLGALALLLAAASSIYLVAGAYSKTMGFGGQPTFDATAYLVDWGSDELAAVRWVRANTQPGDLVVEGKGASYRADLSRISTMTGRPTLLGWDGHEAQWRGKDYADMADGRAQALEVIYRGGTPDQVRQLIEAWGIDYIYVGPSERAQYGTTAAVESVWRQVADVVFESGDVRIYRTR